MCSRSAMKSHMNILFLGNAYVHAFFNRSEPIKLAHLGDRFSFSITLKDPTLEIGCHRDRADPTAEPDAGYALLFHISPIGFSEGVKTAKMRGDEDYAGAEFLLFRARGTSGVLEGYLLKVAVEMVEYELFQGPTFENERQNKDTIESLLSPWNDRVPDMCYLLKMSATEPLVTGRQDEDFAKEKKHLIKRSSMFSDSFADYFRAKAEGRSSKADIEKMDHLLRAVFYHRDIMKMFLKASKLGLDFLKELAVDCMIERVEGDKDLAVCVLMHTEVVGCETLVDKAADCFVRNFKEVTSSDKWKDFTKELPFVAKCVIHTLYVRLSTKELHIPSGLKK